MAIGGPSLQATGAGSGPCATGPTVNGSKATRDAFHIPRSKINRIRATRDGADMAIRGPTPQATGARYVK